MPIHQNQILERLGVNSWAEMYGLGLPEIFERLEAQDDFPLNEGDMLLTMLSLQEMAELRWATVSLTEVTEQLNTGTERLLKATYLLGGFAALTLIVAAATLIVTIVAA